MPSWVWFLWTAARGLRHGGDESELGFEEVAREVVFGECVRGWGGEVLDAEAVGVG